MFEPNSIIVDEASGGSILGRRKHERGGHND